MAIPTATHSLAGDRRAARKPSSPAHVTSRLPFQRLPDVLGKRWDEGGFPVELAHMPVSAVARHLATAFLDSPANGQPGAGGDAPVFNRHSVPSLSLIGFLRANARYVFIQFFGDMLLGSRSNDRDLVRRSWHSIQRERRSR